MNKIQEITLQNGTTMRDREAIREEAMKHFKFLYTEDQVGVEEAKQDMLILLPTLVNDEENALLKIKWGKKS